MKIGIDSYCFHRFFGEVYDEQPPPGKPMTMEDFLDFAAELGVDGVSLESCFFPSMEKSWFVELKARLDDFGLERVYAWGHPTGLEDGTNRGALEDLVAQIDNANLIDAKVMRVTPGPGPNDWRYEPRQPRLDVLAGWFQEAAREAGHRDIKLAAENHGDYTAKEMLWLVEAVGSPYFGVNFDTGNFVRLLDDPVRAMEKLAEHVFATHIKDLKVRGDVSPASWFFFSSTPVGDGLIDMGQIVRLLSEAGYDGLLAVEIDHLHPDYGYDEHLAVRQSIGELRRLVATVGAGRAGALLSPAPEAGAAGTTLAPGPGFRRSAADPRPRAGVGMLGYGFMGKAHSNALRTLTYIDWPGVLRPELVAVAGRDDKRAADAAVRYGFEGYYTDWHGLVEDERVTIFDNAAADSAHVEPTLSAIAAGKHVVCEKPLARSSADARRMWEAAEKAAVKHLCCYNYRFVPAVHLARDMLRDRSLGEIYQARFRYSQGWSSVSPDGSLVTIGCHAIDQARFLVGEITSVSALFSDPLSRAGDRGDHEPPAPGDIVTALVRFAGGVPGTIDASGYCRGRRNMLAWEINCERGTLAWDLERLNELRVSASNDAGASVHGLADVIVCEPGHPSMDLWWPSGHLLGWEHAHTNMFIHFFRCLGEGSPVAPDGATFEDGYRVALISEAMVASALSARSVEIEPAPTNV